MTEMHHLPELRKSRDTRELYSEIEIHASPERIWEILSEFQRYPEWNPFIRSVQGTLAVGERITAYLQPPGGFGMKIHPVILNVVPEREFRWTGHLFIRGLFDGEHVFEIQLRGIDHGLFIQHEYFSGLLIPFIVTMLNTNTARGFADMNKALKARAEQPAVVVP